VSFTPKAIHQFHGGSGVGDAITAGLFHTRELLRGLGFTSEIYCVDVAAELAGEIHGAPTFVDDPDILLLVHFSWAIAYDQWLQRLKCRKALVYHNITPEEFFDDDWFNVTAQLSRRQLAGLRPSMQAALAQSDYSARELARLGYSPVDVLPLLFDPAQWRRAPYDAAYLDQLRCDDAFKILFVGRIVTNKCQEDLLRVMDRLRGMTSSQGRRVKLILVGGLGAGAAYRNRLAKVRQELGLEDCVELAGKVDDARLRALYRGCDVFLSLSEHEGFCVPVIEAMQFDLPVVALASSAVTETVGQGGLLLADKDPGRVAGLLKVLSEEPELRRRLVQAGRRNVQRFAQDRTIHGLTRFLRERLDVAVDVPPGPTDLSSSDRPMAWRLEGPFDSSYSLALVNRSLAKALADCQVNIGLHSTEGDGDFAPNEAFLRQAPDVASMWQRGQGMGEVGLWPDVVLRNLYPPRVSGMDAPTRLLSNWGWEESGLPSSWAARFNGSLNLITTVSRFVAKVLRDNGVKVPIAVVGNGCEHFQEVVPIPISATLGRGRFRFLHVSSGFPRKGIDVLLAAWGRAFTSADDVTLVIKTFPNPHNTVKQQVEALRRELPEAAEIVLLDDDVGAGEMAWLYRQCHALVAPSRGEGFGLPVAEAMLHELPAIVTGHGGMREFCNEQTAWLVDYRFTDAQSHFELFGSVWTEPLADDLVRALREVHAAPAEERARRAKAARETIGTLFTWPAAARRTRQAVADLDLRPVLAPLPRVAWVTSWNVRCGIASYARHLASAFPKGSLLVMASHSNELLEADEPFVQRCWKQGWDHDLEELGLAVRRSGATKAVLQFNFAFYEIKAFGRLLDRLRDSGIECHVVMHSTEDVDKPEIQISLGEIRTSLGRAARLLVHGIADLNRLKGFGLVDNVTLFPHGVALRVPADIGSLRREWGLVDRRVIASFGYLLPNKGLRPLIEAFATLHATQQDLHLLLLTALYPVPDSHEELARCRETIERLGLAGAITLVTDYLSDDRAQAMLQTAELIVYAYQHSQESASGAVRFGLASGRPVACTPLPIFDDVHRVVHSLPGISVADLARGIGELVTDPAKLDRLAERQAVLLAANNWPALSARLWNMLRAPAIADQVEEDRQRSGFAGSNR
jgi:glycosyltransferase involved in cell wall biosynthesis